MCYSLAWCRYPRVLSLNGWSLFPSYLSFASSKMLSPQRVFASWRCLRVWCTGVWRLCRADSPCPSAPHNTGAASASIIRYVVTNPPFQLTVAPMVIACEVFWSLLMDCVDAVCLYFVQVISFYWVVSLNPSIPLSWKDFSISCQPHWTGHKVNTRLAWIYSDAFLTVSLEEPQFFPLYIFLCDLPNFISVPAHWSCKSSL